MDCLFCKKEFIPKRIDRNKCCSKMCAVKYAHTFIKNPGRKRLYFDLENSKNEFFGGKITETSNLGPLILQSLMPSMLYLPSFTDEELEDMKKYL